jgi:hypothetical protein
MRIVVEIPGMRWERSSDGEPAVLFDLIGRAFEVAQRECGVPFEQCLAAFMKGAIISRADLTGAMEEIPEE